MMLYCELCAKQVHFFSEYRETDIPIAFSVVKRFNKFIQPEFE